VTTNTERDKLRISTLSPRIFATFFSSHLLLLLLLLLVVVVVVMVVMVSYVDWLEAATDQMYTQEIRTKWRRCHHWHRFAELIKRRKMCIYFG
jgi:hypothetical protein